MADPVEPINSPDATTVFPYHDLTPPTVRDVFRAKPIVERHLPRTPLVRSEALSEAFDADVYLKREDTLPTGAFKVRGGVTLAARLPERFAERGLVAASTGNHGQSIAYAGRLLSVPVVIVVPEAANPVKVAAMERLGATVKQVGRHFDEAREHAEELASTEGYRYVHSGNEPDLIAGVGTAGLEILEEQPDLEYLFCPVGGGSSASGYCLTLGQLAGTKVIGVQSHAAPGVYEAWNGGHLKPHDRVETHAEGVANGSPFAVPMEILRDGLHDFRLVEEEDIDRATLDLLANDSILAEGAAATSLAAMRAAKEELQGASVAFPISGRNIDVGSLRRVLEQA